jgi:hypothetical protein
LTADAAQAAAASSARESTASQNFSSSSSVYLKQQIRISELIHEVAAFVRISESSLGDHFGCRRWFAGCAGALLKPVEKSKNVFRVWNRFRFYTDASGRSLPSLYDDGDGSCQQSKFGRKPEDTVKGL